jgi:glycosyltransferase EpsF
VRRERSIRALQVIGALGMGGAETWLLEVLRLWSETGDGQLDFLLTSGERGQFDDEARRLGAAVHYVPYGRSKIASFTKAFRQILKSGRYDALHDHADYASGWHFLLAGDALPDVRVTHVHNPWLHIQANYAVSPTRRLTALMGKRLVRTLATHVCGTSRTILEQYGFRVGHHRRQSVSVLHCGIDVAKFNVPAGGDRQSLRQEFGWPDDAKVVLFAGRLDRALTVDHPQNHKNSWFALNVVRAALRTDPLVRLVMAGAGDARRELEAHIEAWGLNNELRLVGVRDDMPRLMRAADVLFFPSRQEGLGMVAVEAQAAGLPVLASSTVPHECVVIPELYQARSLLDSNEAWANALLETMAKPRPDLDRCRAALEASPFSILNSARNLEEMYRGGPG